MKKLFVLALLIVIPLMAFGQGSWFKRGITVGLTGSKIDTITADSESVTFKTPSYTHQLYPITIGTGLTKTGTEVTLGGTLSASVTVANNGALYDFFLQTKLDADSRSSRLSLIDGIGRLYGFDNSTYSSTDYSVIALNGSSLTLEHNGAVSSNILTIDASGVGIATDISGRGLMGSAYYGASILDNDYTQKKYVDDAIAATGTAVTADNGLTKNVGEIELGGTLNRATSIGNDGTYDFDIGTYLTLSLRSAKLMMLDGYALLAGYDNSTYNSSPWSAVRVLGSTASIEHNGAISSRTISLSSSGMVVDDGISSKGLVNAADYSANTTARSLVDSAHVAAMISTATAGVTPGMQDTINDLYQQVFVDTVVVPYDEYVFGMGYGLTGDSAACYSGCVLGQFYVSSEDDTLTIYELPDITAEGAGTPSVAVSIIYDDNTAFSSPTTIWSGTVSGTATTISSGTLTNTQVPPDNHVRAYITATPAASAKSNYLYIPMLHY